MEARKWNESPTVADVILFEFDTPDDDGVLNNPYSIDRVIIYFIERDFEKALNLKSLEEKYYDPKIESEFKELLAGNPDKEDVNLVKSKLEASSFKHEIFYKDVNPVLTTIAPVWLSTKDKNAGIGNLLDRKKNKITGRFGFLWHPKDMSSGDYIFRWNWKIKENSKIRSKYYTFHLGPDKTRKNSIHTRYTPKDKYETLMDKYLPQLFKRKISDDDITFDVIKKLNASFAEGFTYIEDLANELMDIVDANFTHPKVLPLLGNLFNLKLRSDDATLWRRQVKQAIPLFKKKGSLDGLSEALDQSGIKLVKLTNLWQIVSKYTWTDNFVIADDAFDADQTVVGNLNKIPIDIKDVDVCLRENDSKEYIKLPSEIVSIYLPTEAGEKPTLVWNSNKLEQPINLIKGDIVRVKYKYREIPDSEKSIDEYIQSLPLADQRDETKQNYPLKNWNVHLIEEDDPLFDTVIKERHPFYDPVVFGQIRTIFLFGENVYNMDTYDGSLRDSIVPCDIGKDFIDECSYGQSSKFNVDLEIEDLSDDRIAETKEIIREYSPFHAILHQMRVTGKINDFILPPNESVDYLVKGNKENAPKDRIGLEENIMYQIRWKDGKTEMHTV